MNGVTQKRQHPAESVSQDWGNEYKKEGINDIKIANVERIIQEVQIIYPIEKSLGHTTYDKKAPNQVPESHECPQNKSCFIFVEFHSYLKFFT